MLHTIRHAIHNDSLFRQILRGLNKTFYHQTVTTQEIEHYVSSQSGIDFSKVFDQYLRTTQIPVFEYQLEGNKLRYRYNNCITGFNLPIVLSNNDATLRIRPTENWQTLSVTKAAKALVDTTLLNRQYYITVQKVKD